MTCLVAGAAALVGCSGFDSARLDTSLSRDGYALVRIDNDRQQQLDVLFEVNDATPGATYALIYSEDAPLNVGWFELSPTLQPCGGAPSSRCEIPGYGYLVDLKTVVGGANGVELGDAVCGCDADHSSHDWHAHYAVMRVATPDAAGAYPLLVDAHASRVRDYAVAPEIRHLQ